jgi:Tfp pilus assembly protein PilP
MKLTTAILAAVMMTGAAWGQNPDAIDNARSVAKSLQQIKTNESNAALEASSGVPAKPAAGAPAPAVKPATIPGAQAADSAANKPASPAASKPAKAPAPKVASVKGPSSSQNNLLEKVNVVRNADNIQIEISPREAVTPKVSKLSSPARVVVELPATTMATAQNKIPVGSAGVKGVRIGMDGKTPPTTSVVVDLEQAFAYDVTPGPGNKFILTLHTQGAAQTVAKSVPAAAPAKAPVPTPKSQTASAKPVTAPQAPTLAKVSTPTAKLQTAAAKPEVAAAPAKSTPVAVAAGKPATPANTKITATKIAANEKLTVVSRTAEAPKNAEAIKPVEAPKPVKAEAKKWAMNGKRDPFFSPVVQQQGGSGCSTGKKCLEIGQINLRGVVKSEAGFIAVVTNSLNKAYFLHENDPVFNGYVVKITGDSVVFQETVQDKLGKPGTREIVKKITTPAV